MHSLNFYPITVNSPLICVHGKKYQFIMLSEKASVMSWIKNTWSHQNLWHCLRFDWILAWCVYKMWKILLRSHIKVYLQYQLGCFFGIIECMTYMTRKLHNWYSKSHLSGSGLKWPNILCSLKSTTATIICGQIQRR